MSSATPAVSKACACGRITSTLPPAPRAWGAQYFNVYGRTFSEGNTFNELQLNSRAQVVVLDSNARRQLFPHKARVVGEVILVGNMPATVIGVADENSQCSAAAKFRVWFALYHDGWPGDGAVVAEFHHRARQ